MADADSSTSLPPAGAEPQTTEVSGYPGYTLSRAIDEDLIAAPELMSFNDWQRWRRDFGRKPTEAVDGVSMTQTQESALWRMTMEALHGAGWRQELQSLAAGKDRRLTTVPRATTPVGRPLALPPPLQADSASGAAAQSAGGSTELAATRFMSFSAVDGEKNPPP